MDNLTPNFFGHFDLAHTVKELYTTYQRYRTALIFIAKLKDKLAGYVGCPSLVYYVRCLIEEAVGAHIFLKRKDLN